MSSDYDGWRWIGPRLFILAMTVVFGMALGDMLDDRDSAKWDGCYEDDYRQTTGLPIDVSENGNRFMRDGQCYAIDNGRKP